MIEFLIWKRRRLKVMLDLELERRKGASLIVNRGGFPSVFNSNAILGVWWALSGQAKGPAEDSTALLPLAPRHARQALV